MSSEDENEDGFEIRPLRWRSKACDAIFEKLDVSSKSSMSAKARRQTVKRTMGPFSGRGMPSSIGDDDMWAVKEG